MLSRVMEWRRHRSKSASYAIMESNYLFLDSLSSLDLENIFYYFHSYFQITPSPQQISHPYLNESFNTFFTRYNHIKICDTIISYKEVVDTRYDFYPSSVVVIGYEGHRPIFIKRSSQGSGVFPHGEKTLAEIIAEDAPYPNIYYFLLVVLGSEHSLNLEVEYQKRQEKAA